MTDDTDARHPEQQAALEEALAAITAQLASLGDQVADLARQAGLGAPETTAPDAGRAEPSSGPPHETAPMTPAGPRLPATAAPPHPDTGPNLPPVAVPPLPSSQQPGWPVPLGARGGWPLPPVAAPPVATPPAATPPVATPPPSARIGWPVPPGAIVPGSPPSSAAVDPHDVPHGAPTFAHTAAPQQSGAMPTGGHFPGAASGTPASAPQTDTAGQQPSSWADTSGLKALGWVGGAVTVLGVVMLLVVAIQQQLLTPETRVGIGSVLAVLLVVGGFLVRRKEARSAVAVTLVATGLAVAFLTIVGATRLDYALAPAAGQALSALVVAVGVAIALSWRESWLAAAAFAASALLAPVVARHFGPSVYVMECVLLAGAAIALLARVGIVVWAATGLTVALVFLAVFSSGTFDGSALLAVIVLVLITWALFYGRWIAGLAPLDPGPFPLRQRPDDPEQMARDYADFHAHRARVAAAHTDAATATVSLGVSGALLVLGFALVVRPTYLDAAVGAGAALFAVLVGAAAWASGRIAAVDHAAARMITWTVAVALAGVSLLRFLDGDARAVAWLVLAVLVFVVVGAMRARELQIPASALAVVALLSSGPALSPRSVTFWPSSGILAREGGLLPRAWQAVFPAGICVLLLCIAAWWAIARCSFAALEAVRAGQAPRPRTVGTAPREGDDLSAAESRHTVIMAWTIVCCAVVACYGLLVVTMILAYAVSPTRAGFQSGQIIVTASVTLLALVLLWQGFRRFILRIGGLCIALVAVAKLLLIDTGTLEALPRSLTVIGVGVVLLLAAVAYVVALGRLRHSRGSQ